eukprot:SAG22_NODE_8625_length_640_cov_1.730129_1_plen_68_part_01
MNKEPQYTKFKFSTFKVWPGGCLGTDAEQGKVEKYSEYAWQATAVGRVRGIAQALQRSAKRRVADNPT